MTSPFEEPQWLQWVKRLQAVAQNGLAYNPDPFNRQRYEAVRQIAAEMAAAGAGASTSAVLDLFRDEEGHATPKVDVRGLVFRDDRILLVREREDGRWSLPGGWADVYDSPGEATVREVWEEAGIRSRAVRLLALYDRAKHEHPPMRYHVYKAFFALEPLEEGQGAADMVETDGVGYFAENALPELSIGRVTPGQMSRLIYLYRHPELPADFD